MNSSSREYLYNDGAQPIYQGFVNIIGISKIGLQNDEICEYQEHSERFGIVPVVNNMCYWVAAWPSKIDNTNTLENLKAEMRERFIGWSYFLQNILTSAEVDSIKPILFMI